MKFEVLILIIVTLFTFKVHGENLIKFENGNSKYNKETINSMIKQMGSPSQMFDGSGDDDEDAFSSGSGDDEDSQSSGEIIPTAKVTTTDTKSEIIDITVVTKTTEKTPQTTHETTKLKTSTASNNVEEETTENPNDNRVENPNIVPVIPDNEEDEENDVNTAVGYGRPSSQKRKGTSGEDDDEGVSFTLGIIIGVVVGAILAILIIVFLVYRLRKKDEGSYSLDDNASAQFIKDKDSPIKGGEKEYFA